MAAAFRNAGFTISGEKAYTDVCKAGMDAALNMFEQDLCKASKGGRTLGIFYFAGHGGLSISDQQPTELLCLKDTEVVAGQPPRIDELTACSVEKVIDSMRAADVCIAILDSCQQVLQAHNGSFKKAASLQQAARNRADQTLSIQSGGKPSKVLVAYACRRGASASEYIDHGGTFTMAAKQVRCLLARFDSRRCYWCTCVHLDHGVVLELP